MKDYILSLLLLALCLTVTRNCNAQVKDTIQKEDSNLLFINNNKLKYSIVLMSCDTCVPITNVGYRIIVQLSTKEKDIVKNISVATWTKLLTDSSTDFSANLILYYIYNKDAFLLYRNNSKKLWRKYMKKDDLLFWNKKFNKMGR